MASKEMSARLAARIADTVGGDDGEGASVKGGSEDVSGMGGADESTASEVVETAVGETSSDAATPPAAKAEQAETPEQAEARARATRIQLFEEKLADARAKRHGERLRAAAKAEKKAIEDERRAVAAEKAKYEGLKTGSFKETLAALGRDPSKTFAEMQQEAIEASTPEGALRRAQAEAERREKEKEAALEERFKPILSELEQLRAERAQWAAETHKANIHQSYQQVAADPAFRELRIEYTDNDLLEYADFYDKNPDAFYVAANQYGIRLTSPGKGFSMHELLQTLSAAQAAHNSGVQARRAAQSPPERQSGSPTVNGTAPRRNAAPSGNGLAPESPSGAEDRALSPRERLALRTRRAIHGP